MTFRQTVFNAVPYYRSNYYHYYYLERLCLLPTLCAVHSFVPIEHMVPTLPGGTGIVPTQMAGATTSTTNTVCLTNLPADVDDTVLCQLVRPFGTVHSAHVLFDDTNSTKSATVTMANGDEALGVMAAFNGRLLGNCVIQATLSAAHYTDAPASSSLMALQPVLGLLPTAGCQTLLLRNAAAATTAVNSDMMMRQCLPQTYPAQTYELVQLPIM